MRCVHDLVSTAEGELLEVRGRGCSERDLEQLVRRVLQIADGGDAEGGEVLLARAPDAGESGGRQAAQAVVHVGHDERREAAWLLHLTGELGEGARRRNADRAGKLELLAHEALDLTGDLLGCAEEAP